MSVEGIPELNNSDTKLPRLEVEGGVESEDNNKSEKGTRIRGKNMEKFYECAKEGKDFTDDDWEDEGKEDGEYQRKIRKWSKEELSKDGNDFHLKEKNSNILIADFEKEKSMKNKLAILERISELDAISGEVLNFIERFSNNLTTESEKIWEEDGDYANFFEDGSDDYDSIMRPFVFCLTEILEKTKGTEFQSRGEKIATDLLKNWNDFEVDYFYNFIGELNDWKEKEDAKESLVETEYDIMHSEFGIDENIDNFDENIKRSLNLNTDFLHNKNRIINLIGEIGTRESVDFLLEEIVKGKRSAHNNEVATALLKIDPGYARQKLVELMKNSDEIVKVNAAMIFYRTQFGKLTEKRDSEIDNLVCGKFYEIIEQTKLNKEKLQNSFKDKKDISDEEVDKIIQNLINKAEQMLIDFSNEINEGNEMNKNDLLEKLEKYKTDLILTASAYKGIDKENVSFEDLEGVEFEKKNANDLSDEEINQMKDIYARNYEYNPKFQEAILDNFDNILKKSGGKTEIYFYKDNGKIVAFNRFDVMKKGREYFGSFNVDPVLSSSSIGSSLMKASLEKEAENNEIEADCIPETLISSKYIGGKCGFVVRGIDSDYKDTGVALFNIERKEDNKKYHYFNYSDKEIIEEYNSKNLDNQFSSDANQFILKFEPKSKELIDATEKLIEKNYVMSNYVFSKNGKEAYCAFEKED